MFHAFHELSLNYYINLFLACLMVQTGKIKQAVYSIVAIVLNHVLEAVPLGPESELISQLKFQPIPGLLPFHQVGELQCQFIYICMPANFLFFNLQSLHLRVKAVLLLQHRLFLQAFVVNHA